MVQEMQKSGEKKMDFSAPIALIAAMSSELQLLREALEESSSREEYGLTFWMGKIAGHKVVLVQSGIGKVHAARCAQALIDLFHPCVILHTGVAGGIGRGMKIGDLLVAERLAQYDVDVTAFGYARGCLAGSSDKSAPSWFPGDPFWNQLLIQAARQSDASRAAYMGTIVTGDTFVCQNAFKHQLAETFQAQAAEMEGGAVAQVAYFAGVPCSVMRVISDLADEDAPEFSVAFETETARYCSRVLIQALRNFPQ